MRLHCDGCDRRFRARPGAPPGPRPCPACGALLTPLEEDEGAPPSGEAAEAASVGPCAWCGRRRGPGERGRLYGRPICGACRQEVQRRRRAYRQLWWGAGGLVGLALLALPVFLATRDRAGASPAPPPPVQLREEASRPPPPPPEQPAPPPTLSARQIVERTEPSVALISDGSGVGSGFLVRPDVLATNYHVVSTMFFRDIGVRFPARGGAIYRVVDLLHADPRRDLCLLRLEHEGEPLPLALERTFPRGEDVIVIGNPGTGAELVLENAVTRGLLSAFVEIDGQTYYQISASINPGNSGGPVLDTHGRVLCMATLRANEEEGIAFGIPAGAVHAALLRTANATADPRRARAHHDARAVHHRSALVGFVYSVGLLANVSALESLAETGLDPGEALGLARGLYEERLEAVLHRLEPGLLPHYLRAKDSRLVDQPAREALGELWEAVARLRHHVDEPAGRVDRYIHEGHRLLEAYRRAVDRSARTLDIPTDDTAESGR